MWFKWLKSGKQNIEILTGPETYTWLICIVRIMMNAEVDFFNLISHDNISMGLDFRAAQPLTL